uniref:Methyltransf_21 domain-containing protein n=1 Tax=Haemonchus placei TaxID=6290 RepID=A0A0N4W9W8_HAEPC
LGIGADIKVEQPRILRHPPCQTEVIAFFQGSEFYGADPVTVPNADLFGRIGRFFPIAKYMKVRLLLTRLHHVASPAATVSRISNNCLGKYKTMPVVHLDIGTFFTKMINRTHIDHMILDNEGPEYQLMPMIAIENVFAKQNIDICHMNVEVGVARKAGKTFLSTSKVSITADRYL